MSQKELLQMIEVAVWGIREFRDVLCWEIKPENEAASSTCSMNYDPPIPPRMRDISTDKQLYIAWTIFCRELQKRNFSTHETQMILHAINSMYMMGKDFEKFRLDGTKRPSEVAYGASISSQDYQGA